MKAKQEIWIPNLRVLEKYGVTLPESESSSFKILIGEDVDEAMSRRGLTLEEAKVYKTRILRGNPHWVSLEEKVEVKNAEEAKEDLNKERKRKEQLEKLSKKEQSELLVKLGVDKKQVPLVEADRVNLIFDLENKQ